MCKVVKRDGSVVDFDENKIKTAIAKAYSEVQSDITNEEKVISDITNLKTRISLLKLFRILLRMNLCLLIKM